MGSYTDFSVAGYPLITTKSYVEPIFMTVFRESDKRITPERLDSSGDVEEDRQIKYAVTVSVAKSRLGVMGFSLRNAQSDFDEQKGLSFKAIQDDAEDASNWTAPIQDEVIEDSNEGNVGLEGFRGASLYDVERRAVEILRNATFNDFIEGFRYLRLHSLMPYFFTFAEFPSDTPTIVKYMSREEDGPLLGFPCSDARFLLRAFLESVDECDEVAQDISSVVEAGYYEESDDVCRDALDSLTDQYPVNERIIILTEGSTDSRVLDRTLHLLYPHLAGYYSFMDFDSSNAMGSAGSLVSTLKAFCGAGISNRVIALFDNDTAAEDAIRGLRKTSVPTNIRMMRYPTLELAKSYPTVGPGGVLSEMDINGLACSLELYFGRDVLTTGSKTTLTPIQWMGYSKTLERYQGEILEKARLIEKYKEKLDQCEADHSRIEALDFSGMRTLLDAVFSAFQ